MMRTYSTLVLLLAVSALASVLAAERFEQGEVIVEPESVTSQIRILKSKDPSDSKIMKSKDSDFPVHLKNSKPSETDKPNETKPIRTKIVQSPNDMSDVLFVLTEGPSQLDRFPRGHKYLKERKSLLKNVRVANTEADEFAIFPAARNVVVPSMLSKKHNSKVLSEGHDRLWTLLGAMPGLDEYIRDEQSRNIHRAWVFIVKDSRTTIHYSKMQKLISNLDQEKTNSFIGRGLKDNLDTGVKIIHHYDNSQMLWPDIQAGVLLSTDLVQKLAEKIRTAPPKMAFTIDAPYELARFLREELNVDLQSSEVFCYPDEADVTGNQCATVVPGTIDLSASGSQDSVSDDAIMYAVKTHTANHYTRVETIKKTWVQDAKHITFYSDQADEKVPTKETKGVPNTKRGHCGKLEYILRDLWKNRADFKWFAVVDDDTSISPKRLARLLHKYTTTGSESVIVGEKYGFMFNQPQYGYEYPTLGCGIAISREALRFLVEDSQCACPAVDSPDDMWIGSCLRHHSGMVQLIGHPGFHQEHPTQYHPRVLARSDAVAFHRTKADDAEMIYTTYLGGGQ